MFVDLAPSLPPQQSDENRDGSEDVEYEESASDSTSGSSAREDGFLTEVPPNRGLLCWMLYGVNLSLMMLSLMLSLFIFLVLIKNRNRRFNSSFYTILLTFVTTIIISNMSEISTTVYFEVLLQKSPVLCNITLLLSLIVSYYSAILTFLLGLSRFAAFCCLPLNRALSKTKIVLTVLVSLLAFSAIAGYFVYKISGFSRSFDEEDHTMRAEAANPVLFTMSCYAFYTIPLLSTVFYLLCFLALRSQRSTARTEKTIVLLSKAERSTLMMGIVILLFYMNSLLIHVLLRFHPPRDMSYFVLSRIEVAISTTPQLAIPLTVLGCSKDIREASWQIASYMCLRKFWTSRKDSCSGSGSAILSRKRQTAFS